MSKAKSTAQALCLIATASLHRTVRVPALASALSWPSAAVYAESPAWPDSPVTRLQALALMQSLNAEILGSQSATLSLEKWCRDHKLSVEPKVVARVIGGVNVPPDAGQLERLEVSSAGEVKYRRVQLECGDHVLSVADNWYVPGRLSAETNLLLETTGTPFGTAVRALKPYRRTLAVKLLWLPLPDGWELGSPAPAPPTVSPAPAPATGSSVPATGSPGSPATATGSPAAVAGSLAMPDALFEHRAILYTRDHKPFSEVHEVYQRQILAFPAPRS